MAAPSEHEESPSNVSCDDFSFFKDVMKKMRVKDDMIANALNTTVPTASFAGEVNASEKCKSLYQELQQSHGRRVDIIRKCLSEVSTKVDSYKKQHEADMDSLDLLKALRKEQLKFRQMQAELSVEEIVMDQSLKVFHERCRRHYIPPKENP